jgi:toxin FitB
VIVLDTNVISELMRPRPEHAVLAWIAAQPRDTLFTTSINKAEILFSISVLPDGRRRRALFEAADAMFAEDFHDCVLPFGADASSHYAAIVADRRRAGRPIEAFDALIAATARAARASLATRDTSGFTDCGLDLIDPWKGS